MNQRNITPSTQTYRLLLYQRALHPELFNIKERRNVKQDNYELDSWLMPSGHIIQYQANGITISELVTEQDSHFPDRGLVQTIPCLGEKDIEDTIEDKVHYVTSVQTEFLTENLFAATYQEMLDYVEEVNAVIHQWEDEDGSSNMSILDMQRYKREIHTQSYHLIGCAGFILRTQSIFELA